MNNAYEIPLLIGGTTLAVVMLSFMVGILFVQKNKQNAYKRKLLEARVDEHEKTLNEVSKELHDNVGQLLSFAIMNVAHIGNFAVDSQQGLIQITNNVLDEALLTVRHISHSLSGETVRKKGLLGTLAEEIDFIKTSKKLDCSMELYGEYKRMLPEVELAVFRIAQEAITNTLKHANAGVFNIRIEHSAAGFVIIFTDNGNGFNAEEEIKARKGIGLINMMERAKVINGNLEISATPTNGCRIRLSLPAPQQQ